jgi:hypothetical protein
LLRIPKADDVVPPLLIQQLLKDTGPEQSGGGSGEGGVRNIRRKRKRKRRGGETLDWEEKGRRVRPRGSRNALLGLFIGLVTLGAILGIVVFTTFDDPASNQAEYDEDPEELIIPEGAMILTPSSGGPDVGGDPEAADARRGNAQFLTDAHPVARAFLEATTVEDLLKVVDRPDVVAERIKRVHPEGVIEPLGLGDYSQFSQVRRIGPYGIIPLRTRDLQIRMMTFRVYPDELKVDWESWVGWSDTEWDEFIENRPSGLHVFRVNFAAVEYYNFDFNDDRKWQSFRLISPDAQHSIYGYVEKNSPAHIALRSILEQGFSQAMVEVRFAEGASTGEQVEITRVVAEDWIDPERAAEP